jgi:hypothetical protein
MARSYLFENCDYLLNYAGCVDKPFFLWFDIVMIILHCTSICLYGYAFLKQALKLHFDFKKLSLADYTSIFAIGFHCIRIAFLYQVQSIGNVNWTNEELLQLVKTNIILQFFQNGTASLCANAFMTTFLSVGTGAKLFRIYQIRGYEIDPQKLLTLVRLTLIIYSLAIVIIWAQTGLTEDLGSYYLYKRKAYLPFGLVVFFITGPIQLYNGRKIINVFEEGHKKKQQQTIYCTSDGTKSVTIHQTASTENRDTAAETGKKRVVFGLKAILYSVYFLLNFMTGLLFIFTPFILELYQDNQTIFVFGKVLFDLTFYFCSTIFAFYLLWK